MGFRANHLRLTRPNADAISIKVTVNVVEITGSESFVHLQHADDRWVALVHGIQQPASGTELEVYVDPADVYVFGTDDALVLAPAIAAAA